MALGMCGAALGFLLGGRGPGLGGGLACRGVGAILSQAEGSVFGEPFALVVTPSLPVESVDELIAYAKEHPGGLRYAAAGNGGPTQLNFELFKIASGTDIAPVVFDGRNGDGKTYMARQMQRRLDSCKTIDADCCFLVPHQQQFVGALLLEPMRLCIEAHLARTPLGAIQVPLPAL